MNPSWLGHGKPHHPHPLMECVEKTKQVAEAINAQDYEKAMSLRSASFKDAFRTLKTMIRALPHPPDRDRSASALPCSMPAHLPRA